MSSESISSTSTSRHFDIKITLQDGKDAVPGTIPVMKVGDTVRYVSDDGKVTIVFPDRSPFRRGDVTINTVQDGEILPLVVDSMGPPEVPFTCRCFLTLPNSVTVGWKSDPSPSGGEHRVQKP